MIRVDGNLEEAITVFKRESRIILKSYYLHTYFHEKQHKRRKRPVKKRLDTKKRSWRTYRTKEKKQDGRTEI